MLIVKTTKGHIFGGFTTQNWTKNDTYIDDNQALIFSINPKTEICNVDIE